MQKNKKDTPFLDVYKESMLLGELPLDCLGLCALMKKKRLSTNKIWKMVNPTKLDLVTLKEEGKDDMFWASNSKSISVKRINPLRQTILLLCACINEEY